MKLSRYSGTCDRAGPGRGGKYGDRALLPPRRYVGRVVAARGWERNAEDRPRYIAARRRVPGNGEGNFSGDL